MSSRNSDCNVDCREERARPVCGTDGRTYKSMCDLEKAKCEGHPPEFKHHGKCPESMRCRAERAHAQAQARNVRGMVYIPECREDGSFVEVQCQTSIGYCWCVDQWGKPVPGSSLRYKKPVCAQQGCRSADRTKFNNNIIEIFTTEYMRIRPTTSDADTGADAFSGSEAKRVVQWKFDELDTNNDNSLKRKEVRDLSRMTKRIVTPRECAKSFTKYCDLDQDNKISRNEWYICLGVDIGKETPSIWERHGMRLKHYEGDDESDPLTDNTEEADGLNYAELQDCLSSRASAMESHRQDPEGGIYIPECSADGSYQKSQCHKTTSVCWCVNPKNGKPIRGTAARGSRPDCDNVLRSARTFKGCSIQKKQMFLGEFIKSITEQIQYSSKNVSQRTQTKEEVIRWKFNSLDTNDNQTLEKEEWLIFRNEWKHFLKTNKRRRKARKLRRCWRNFPRYCDENNNNQITEEEWLWCTNAGRDVRGQLPVGQKRRGPNPFSTILKSD